MRKNLGFLLLSLCLATAAQANTAQYKGPMVIEGPWMLNDQSDSFKDFYKVPASRFGTFEILMPDGTQAMAADGKPAILRELHYQICSEDSILSVIPSQVTGNSNQANVARCKGDRNLGVGLRPIPVVDGFYSDINQAEVAEVPTSDGGTVTVKGSEEIDNFLRTVFRYKNPAQSEDPIYSIIAYNHPEIAFADFMSVGDEQNLKTESGITHLGAYLGKGSTRNSPVDYHEYTWQNATYPTLVYTVQYQGAKDQKTFNENANIALQVLNELNGGPVFPSDYKFDFFRSINLKETFAFYRAWVDPTWIREEVDAEKPFFEVLQNSDMYATYCAEHITVALNVALNLAQNKQGYVDVWGEEVGSDLWEKVQKRWMTDRTIGGESVENAKPLAGRIAETDYIPLWKLDKTGNPTEETTIGKSMAWQPETTSDLLRDYLANYANWTIVSPVLTTAVVMGFAPQISQRTGTSDQKILEMTVPVLESMYKHYAAFMLSKELDKNETLVKMRDGEKEGEEKSCGFLWLSCIKDAAVNYFATDEKIKEKVMETFAAEKAYETVMQKYQEGLQTVVSKMEEQLKAGEQQVKEPMAQLKAFMTQVFKNQGVENPTDEQIFGAIQSHEMWQNIVKAMADLGQEMPMEQWQAQELVANYIKVTEGLKQIERRKSSYMDAGNSEGLMGKLSTEEAKVAVYEEALQLFKNADLNGRMNWAYSKFMKDVKPHIENAQKEPISISFEDQYVADGALDRKVQYYSSPATVYRAANGVHAHHPRIKINAVATVMDASEVIKTDNKRVICDPTVGSLKDDESKAALATDKACKVVK